MAEYRGLTIRIGADVGNFKSSLQSTQSAIAATQKSLRELKKSMVLDPGSNNVAAKYVGELQSNAVAASAKLGVLAQQVQQISSAGSKSSEGSTIKDLAKDTDDAVLSAKMAVQNYNEMTAALKQVNDQINKTQTAQALLKAWENSEGQFGLESELRAPNTKLEVYQQIYDAMVATGEKTQEQANQELAMIQRLKSGWQDANDARADADMVMQLHNAEVEAANLEAKIKGVVAEMADATGTALSRELADEADSMQRIGVAAEQARAKLDNVDKALSFDPTNVDRIAAKTSALTELQDSLRLKLTGVNGQLERLRSSGVDELATDTADLAAKTDEARQKYEAAADAVVRLRGELAVAQQQQQNLVANDKQGTDEYREKSAEVENLKEQLKGAEAALNEADAAYTRFKDANKFTELTNEAEGYRNELREVASQLLEMQRSELSISLEPERERLSSISDEADAARQRFNDLNEALKLDPTNIDLARQRSEALRDAQDAARQKVEQLQTIIGKLKSAGLDQAVKSTKNLSQATKDAEREYTRAADKVQDLEDALDKAVAKQLEFERKGDTLGDDYKDACADVIDLTDELSKAAKAAQDVGEKVKTLRDAGELSGTSDSLASALREQKQLAEDSKLVVKDLTTSSFQAMQQLGQYARQAIQEVVSASYDLEEAYTNMMKTVDGTDEQYNKLKESAVQASLQNPVSADQILNVEALGGQLGFTIDELEEFQRVANGLDISTNMNWEDAATNMAQFANIMQMNHEDIGRYGAAIVDLGNNFATTEADISDMAMRIAGAGATLGLSEADVLGLSAALTSMGLTAEAGGSSISQIMLKIDKAVANGTDGVQEYADKAGMSISQLIDHVKSLDSDALSDFAKGLGTTAKDLQSSTVEASEQLQIWAETAGYDSAEKFADAWRESPIKALQSVFSGMDAAADDGTNLALLLDDLNIKTIRQGDVARRLANNSGLLTDAVKAANDAWRDNVALDEEVERRNQSLSGRMDVLANAFTAIKTEMGEGLSPLVDAGINVFSGLAKLLDTIPDGAKTAIIVIGGLATAIGGIGVAVTAAAPVFETLAAGFSVLVAGAGDIGASFALASEAIGGLVGISGAAMAALAPLAVPIAAVAAGLGMWAYSSYTAKKRTDGFNDAMSGMDRTMDLLSQKTTVGAQSLESFSSASKDLSLEHLTEEINDFNKSIEEMQEPVTKSNAMLGEYQTVIDEFAGVGKDSIDASGFAELQWAVDGLNTTLGTNYDAMDVLNGKYEDEKGNLVDIQHEIDNLIMARQRQAEADAAMNIYTEAVEQRMRLEDEAAQKEQEYWESVESYQKHAIEAGEKRYGDIQNMTKEQFSEALRNDMGNDGTYREMWADLESYHNAAAKAADVEQAALDRLADAQIKASDEAKQMYDILNGSYANVDISWSKALQDSNIEMKDFVGYAIAAGVSVQDLQNILNDPDVLFADMVKESGGDLEKLIEIIRAYNDTDPETKEVNQEGAEETKAAVEETTAAVEEADGKSATYEIGEMGSEEVKAAAEDTAEAVEAAGGTAESEFTQSGGEEVVEQANEIKAAKEEAAGSDNQVDMSITATNEVTPVIEEIRGEIASLSEASAVIPITATNEASPVIEEIRGQLMSLAEAFTPPPISINPEEYDAQLETAQKTLDAIRQKNIPQLHANNAPLISAVQNAQSAINGLRGRTVYVYVDVNTSEIAAAESRIASLSNKAATVGKNAAGGIRYHAEGFIADRPTWISNRDIVGEAGAEAIIPLTNKKYVDPFAGAVANQMLHKMNGMEGGNTITVNLNYRAGDDANQMARDLARALGRIQRTGR